MILAEPNSIVANELYKRASSELNFKFHLIYSDHLIKNLCVNDSISREGNAALEWYLENEVIPFKEVFSIYNDIQDLYVEYFDHVHDEDKDYCRHEFRSYLQFSLMQISNTFNRPSHGSLSGSTQSLPLQWSLIKNRFININVPSYYYDMIAGLPSEISKSYNVIFSRSPYNYTNWNVDNKIDKSEKLGLFYIRPSGKAFTCITVGDKIIIDSLSINLTELGIVDLLKDISNFIRSHFDLEIFQSLYFYDEIKNQITFGCASPKIYYSQLNDITKTEYIEELFSLLTKS